MVSPLGRRSRTERHRRRDPWHRRMRMSIRPLSSRTRPLTPAALRIGMPAVSARVATKLSVAEFRLRDTSTLSGVAFAYSPRIAARLQFMPDLIVRRRMGLFERRTSMPFSVLFPATLSSVRARLRRGASLRSIPCVAEYASVCKSSWITLGIWMPSMGAARHIAAAILAVVGIAIASESGAWAQGCKVEAPQMCSSWLWEEINGGIPLHLDCAGGHLTCLAIVKGDMKVNGYKRQAWGWHTLASNFPSPGSIEVFVPNGCACDVTGMDCVCLYPTVGTTVVCPNLANPNSSIGDCP